MGQGEIAPEMENNRRPEAEHLLEYVCRQIVEGLGATSCSLSDWNRPENKVTTRITYARQPDLEQPLHIEAGDSYSLEDYPSTARVLRERVAIAIRVDDPLADPAERHLLQEAGQQALLMLPLIIEDEVIGLLEVFQRDQPRSFTPEEISLAQSLGRQASLVIGGSRLFLETQREARDLATLLQASSEILSTLDLDTVLQKVAEQLARLTGTEGTTVSRYDADTDSVVTWAEYASERAPKWHLDPPGTSYSLKDYPLTAQVLQKRIAVVVQADDPRADPAERALLVQLSRKSLLMLPMVAYNRVVGIVELMTAGYRRDFTPREISLAQTLTNQAAIAIENARLYSQGQRQVQELHRISEAQTRLLDMMRIVSTPVIPVHDRILILPLIGTVDSERARQFTERLLEAVRRQRARVVLVDITGVPVVDTAVAQVLLQTAEATRLLGAEVVLVGVRSEVAQTLVMLGLNMTGVVTKADLQAGVAYALGQLGMTIVAKE